MLEKLYFYYTNDLHSHFSQWPRVAAFMKKKKEQAAIQGASCWLADIGDHVDRVHPIAEAYMGKANVALLNEAGYDLATFGNNEGITLAHDDLFHLYDEASFQVVCANMTGEQLPVWLNCTVTVTSKGGVKIGVLGLTAPFNDYYDLLGWHMDPPWEALAKYLPGLRQEVDIIVLLSHLGISEDREIANRFPEIDVIIGSHTHHLLKTGEYVNNAVITAAGKGCTHAGEVILTWDHNQKKIVDSQAYATDITAIKPDEKTVNRIKALSKSADEILQGQLTYLSAPLHVDWYERTNLIQSLTDTLLEWTKADCAMLNAGLLLGGLPAGEVMYKDVHRICPHPINPCVVKLTGSELQEVVRVANTKEFTHFHLKGFGFRGELLGKMVYAGLQVFFDTHQNGHLFVREVHVQDKPLEPDRVYRVATADTFTFGNMLPEIAKATSKHYFVPEFLRDLLAYTLKQQAIRQHK